MKRRDFLKTSLFAAAAAGMAPALQAWVPSHNWERYDFGGGPQVKDRLYQGPFPQYEPEAFYGGSVVQYTTPGRQMLDCFGMGLTSYIAGDLGAPSVPGKSLERVIDELAAFPLATKLYIRPNWRHIQKRAGRLDFDDYWKITFEKAAKYGKRVGFRIMLNNPDILEDALPEFMLKKVPMHKLKGTWKGNPDEVRYQKVQTVPKYDDPYFLACYEEMMALLAQELNGSPLVEYMDTCMYGFWGEGHTWPYEDHPFDGDFGGEPTFLKMYDIQNRYWDKVPLLTAWTAAAVECGLSDGRDETMHSDDAGIPRNEAIISHVKDVGANYFSLWNWHHINADNLYRYYRRHPEGLDDLASSIGFRVRPSWIWVSGEDDGRTNLIFGMVNDGIACVPGVLRLTLFTDDGKVNISGCLDAGYPKTRGVRQAMMTLPAGVGWNSGALKLKAELEVKGVRHPVPFAVAQKLNPDGSLTIRGAYM